jgi:hypothetical protein
MISSGSSSSIRKDPSFGGGCYGDKNPPKMYNDNVIKQRDTQELGMMNNKSDKSCSSDRSLSYMNPLILNYFN